VDDVVVPPEFERYVIVRWGDRVFPGQDDYVGYNHDYTAFIPLEGDHDGLLWVNHE
jgi:secreted PhoX family phosphatase